MGNGRHQLHGRHSRWPHLFLLRRQPHQYLWPFLFLLYSHHSPTVKDHVGCSDGFFLFPEVNSEALDGVRFVCFILCPRARQRKGLLNLGGTEPERTWINPDTKPPRGAGSPSWGRNCREIPEGVGTGRMVAQLF